MPEPSLQNLSRATGLDMDELAHLFVCPACTPVARCDANPALVREAVAAYRGAPRQEESGGRVNRRRGEGVGDAEEFRRIREEAGVRAPLAGLSDDPRKN